MLQFVTPRQMRWHCWAAPLLVTGRLVKLFRSDERLARGRDRARAAGISSIATSLRHLLEGSASALIVGALVGDVSGVSALTVNAPILLSTLHYTRESEREAGSVCV